MDNLQSLAGGDGIHNSRFIRDCYRLDVKKSDIEKYKNNAINSNVNYWDYYYGFYSNQFVSKYIKQKLYNKNKIYGLVQYIDNNKHCENILHDNYKTILEFCNEDSVVSLLHNCMFNSENKDTRFQASELLLKIVAYRPDTVLNIIDALNQGKISRGDKISYYLGYLQNQHLQLAVEKLKPCLDLDICQQDCMQYQSAVEIIYACSQKMSWSEFYEAFHSIEKNVIT